MTKNQVVIIAEAGVNHNGCIETAKKLIDVAVDAKVDYVKFQTFKAEKLVASNAPLARYQKSNIGKSQSNQNNMLKALELSHDDHIELIRYCKERGIKFFSTAFDPEGIDYLNSLGFELFKIPSGEITNYPYLKKIASYGKPTILSTGMSTMFEIKQALNVLTSGISKKDITVLHCNTEYPTPMEDVNLKAMLNIQKTFDIDIGYSDHTMGIEIPIAAVALGAKIIEKHFTLDRNLPGPDHRASLEPKELKTMVKCIRNTELAFSGSGEKVPSESEKKNIKVVRKSLYLKKDKNKGDQISPEDLITLRPGTGISPMKLNEVIGKQLTRDLSANTPLNYQDLC